MEQHDRTDDLLGLVPVLIRLNRVLTQQIDTDCNLDITPTQMHALIVLHKTGATSLSGLTEYLGMQKQQMTKISGALVKKGYASRATDPDNRRTVIIELTEEGKKAIGRIKSNHNSAMGRFLALLDEENRVKFLTGLGDIISAISSLDV